jgi:hypothetical protein
MRYAWLAATALFAAGCSSVLAGAGQAVPAAAPRTTHSATPTAPSRAPITAPAGAPTSSANPAPEPAAPVRSTCAPAFFGVAGSGQGPQNPAPRAVARGVSRVDAHAYGTAVGLVKTDLVELAGGKLAATQAIDYPATGLPDWVGAGGLTANLDASEAQGTRALVAAIRSAERGACLGRAVLLAGYSQGAEVVIRAVDALPPQQRAGVAVVLFGNPSYRPGLAGDYPGTVQAGGLRRSITGTGYALPTAVRARTLDICAPGDPVCGMSPAARTLPAQLSYLTQNAYIHGSAYAFGSAGYPRLAAQFLWQHR